MPAALLTGTWMMSTSMTELVEHDQRHASQGGRLVKTILETVAELCQLLESHPRPSLDRTELCQQLVKLVMLVVLVMQLVLVVLVVVLIVSASIGACKPSSWKAGL